MTVDLHAGMALTGIQMGDSSPTKGQAIPGRVLTDRVAVYAHAHVILYLRPFGATAIIASSDDEKEGPELYMAEPQGTAYKYYACCVGKQKTGAKAQLERINFETVTCREALMEIAKII